MDLTTLPPKVYGALCKLLDMEHPVCPTNDNLIRRMSDEELAVTQGLSQRNGYSRNLLRPEVQVKYTQA